MIKGYTHIYTGNGKGKTTAAFGLALRALGHDFKIYIAQFMKAMEYGEVKFLKKFIDIEQFGVSTHLISTDEVDPEHFKAAQKGYKKVLELVKSDKYDMIILDEIIVSHFFKLITLDQIINIIKNKNPKLELILTGRYAVEELYQYADLISEIKEIKHYYNTEQTPAREGIEN